MKGAVLLPSTFGEQYVTDRYTCLFRMLEDKLGFEVIFTSDSNSMPADVEVVIAFKSPQHSHVNSLMGLTSLPKRVKLIGYFVDLHGGGDYLVNMEQMLERCDVVLCSYDEMFRKKWPQFIEKYVFFPHCFAPHERFAQLPFNRGPVLKCVLAGARHPGVYPLREVISQGRGDIVMPPHPGGHTKKLREGVYTRERYAELLYCHFCGVATSSRFNYVVAKYFEIPATGALLLANEVPDLKKLGFIPGVHYVAISEENALDKIDECLNNPEAFTEIRIAGMEFVRENHSVRNRFEQLKRVLEAI